MDLAKKKKRTKKDSTRTLSASLDGIQERGRVKFSPKRVDRQHLGYFDGLNNLRGDSFDRKSVKSMYLGPFIQHRVTNSEYFMMLYRAYKGTINIDWRVLLWWQGN